MGKLEVTQVLDQDLLSVTINGSIDEDVDFTQHKLKTAGKIIFDLENVKSINSCGIREWIKWMDMVSTIPLVFVKCPKIIVDQMNMVAGFLPANGRVNSFYVPYYSEDSGEEKNVLFSRGTEFDESGVKDPEVKDSKGGAMEMDVIVPKYFKFLKQGN